jgi:hypothetical protein
LEYTVTERGPHHRVWSCVTWHTNAPGAGEAQTNSYTELATGLHFFQDGQWVESREEIAVVAEGAVARAGQHKVNFAANLATAGAVDLELPDGQRLRSHVPGLSYFDASSGKSVVIAEVRETAGELQPPNVLLFPNAFTDLKADVRYTYTRAGLEQDVILRERPPRPEVYGLNPATTRLQVWTEFVEAPAPVRTGQAVRLKGGGELTDETVAFATMQITRGRAFMLGEDSAESETSVAKRWVTVDGRTCLVEEVALPDVRAALEVLPQADEAAVRPPTNGVRHAVSTQPLLPAPPARRLARAGGATIQLAQARSAEPGLVLDYVVLNATEANYTFKGDETYLVTGPVNLNGTATFEGGTVIKYAKNAGAKLCLAALNCQTGPYRPAVFTARDDNSVGQNISTGTLSGYYANSALEFWSDPPATWCLTNFRVAYAQLAVKASSQAFTLLVEHGQIVHCGSGVRLPGQGDTSLRNVLIGDVQTLLSDLAYANITAQHVTFAGPVDYPTTPGILASINSLYPTVTLRLTNCVLANLNAFVVGGSATLYGEYNGFYQTASPFGNPAWNPGINPFVERGAGKYYLADSSAFRNVGTTALVPELLEALRHKTTAPPADRTTHFSNPETLGRNPQVPRDTALGDLPDLGYHYEPLDYVVNARTVSAPLTLSGGVVLGTYGAIYSYGLALTSGGSFTSVGTPADLNWIVRYNTVQEQSVSSWSSSTVGAGVKRDSPAAAVSARLTGWSLLAGVGEHFKDDAGGPTPTAFTDCHFGGGKFTVYPGSTTLKNCLWERVYVSLRDDDVDPQWALYNNAFYGGTFTYRAMGDAPVLQAYDNLFERTAIIKGLHSQPIMHDHNGYIASYSRLLPIAGEDVVLDTMVYATGSLGRWYHGNAALTDKGSRSAGAAGMACATTRTAHQTDEGTVDIGFHYRVAGPLPIAMPLTVLVCRFEDTPIDLLPWGYSPGGCSVWFAVVTGPSYGTLTGNPPDLLFRPDDDYEGEDTFTYKVIDDAGQSSAPATVYVTAGEAPQANGNAVVTDLSRSTIPITLTGSDICDDPLEFEVQPPPPSGVLGGEPPALTYTPVSAGYDNLYFVVNDGLRDSGLAQVSITVLPRLENLTASCGPWWILLEWEVPVWIEPYVWSIRIERAPAGGQFSVIKDIDIAWNIASTLWFTGQWETPRITHRGWRRFVDASVTAGNTYYYRLSYRYADPATSQWYYAPAIEEPSATTCPTAFTCSVPAFEPAYWNNDDTRLKNNCYNYANNVRTDTFAQPGRASGDIAEVASSYTVETVSEWAENDGMVPTTREAPTPEGMTKVALVINPGVDFHWYRRDAGGLWSHKPGLYPATNKDYQEMLITDPETADTWPYTEFAGYFHTCSSSVQGQGHADIE